MLKASLALELVEGSDNMMVAVQMGVYWLLYMERHYFVNLFGGFSQTLQTDWVMFDLFFGNVGSCHCNPLNVNVLEVA